MGLSAWPQSSRVAIISKPEGTGFEIPIALQAASDQSAIPITADLKANKVYKQSILANSTEYIAASYTVASAGLSNTSYDIRGCYSVIFLSRLASRLRQ